MKCVVCNQEISSEGERKISNFAAYGGLPSPCCTHCMEVNDYSIKNLDQLKFRSWRKALEKGLPVARDDGAIMINDTETRAILENAENIFAQVPPQTL